MLNELITYILGIIASFIAGLILLFFHKKIENLPKRSLFLIIIGLTSMGALCLIIYNVIIITELVPQSITLRIPLPKKIEVRQATAFQVTIFAFVLTISTALVFMLVHNIRNVAVKGIIEEMNLEKLIKKSIEKDGNMRLVGVEISIISVLIGIYKLFFVSYENMFSDVSNQYLANVLTTNQLDICMLLTVVFICCLNIYCYNKTLKRNNHNLIRLWIISLAFSGFHLSLSYEFILPTMISFFQF